MKEYYNQDKHNISNISVMKAKYQVLAIKYSNLKKKNI
jgi:hypothetical protein